MQNIIEDFNERVLEIEEYLNFLKLISEPNIRIHGKGHPKAVSVLTLKTMKAQVFLMLYNLVESSIRGSMDTLYNEMTAHNGAIEDFEEFTIKLWINQKISLLDSVSATRSGYVNLITSMVDDILLSNKLVMNPSKLPISGNLDGRKIRELFELHQIPTKTHYRALNGVELVTVKNKRNALSHGDESFAVCGQQFTVETLVNIKQQTVIYLRSALKNVKKYVEQKKYAA
jgi:hypothetical protein